MDAQTTPWQATRYPELADLGSRQAWVFSRQQLRELGWGPQRVDHEIAMHRWRLLSPTVVLAGNGAPDLVQRWWAGHLHAGLTSALTHLTACHSSGLRWPTQDTAIHVITAKGDLVEPLPGYVFHQTRRPCWRWVESPPVGPPRLDLPHAALLTAERDRYLRRAIGLLAAVVQQRLATPEQLLTGIVSIRKLRNGKHFLPALQDIAGGAESFAEIDVVRLCQEAGLAPPLRQTRRRDKDGRWRYLDLEWQLPDGRRLVLEVDGSFHMRTENWWQDKRRERAEVVSGSILLRCASVELRLSPQDVLDDLRAIGVPRSLDSSAVA